MPSQNPNPNPTARLLLSLIILTLIIAISDAVFSSITFAQAVTDDNDSSNPFNRRRSLRKKKPHKIHRCHDSRIRGYDKLSENMQTLEEMRAALAAAGTEDVVVTIPVVFHIVKDGTKGDVPIPVLENTIENANIAYAGQAGFNGPHSDTRFRFFIQGVIYWNIPSFFNNCEKSASVEDKTKSSTAVFPESIENVWTCKMSEYLGWSVFPWSTKETSAVGGIVLSQASFALTPSAPGYKPIPKYDEGDTFVHETGHYLGLYHTFQGGCTNPNDDVMDTPQEKTAHYGFCSRKRDTCPKNPGLDPIRNYMDYSADACLEEFTPGQITRMHFQSSKYRPTMYSMSTPVRCTTDGVSGNAHKYGLCRTATCEKTLPMPDGTPAPHSGWCYVRGTATNVYGSCVPGCGSTPISGVPTAAPTRHPTAQGQTPAPTPKPVVTSSPTHHPTTLSTTASPVPAPAPEFVHLDPKTCLARLTYPKGAARCAAKNMTVCSLATARSGAIKRAAQSTSGCGDVAHDWIWVGQSCSTKGAGGAISAWGADGTSPLCEKGSAWKYRVPCCDTNPSVATAAPTTSSPAPPVSLPFQVVLNSATCGAKATWTAANANCKALGASICSRAQIQNKAFATSMKAQYPSCASTLLNSYIWTSNVCKKTTQAISVWGGKGSEPLCDNKGSTLYRYACCTA